VVLRGEPEKRAFSAFYLKGGLMIVADTVSRPKDFVLAKRFVTERIPVLAAALADESIQLATLISSSKQAAL
jgi:3-phenylpropionate/trans-cinnamate dioxygenase ferredoxin reductase subunit